MSNDPVGFFPSGPVVGGGGGGLDEKVKVSSDDTTTNYLGAKLSAGTGILLNVLNDGANESVEITSTGGADDEEVLVPFSYTDAYPLNIATVDPIGTVSKVAIYIDTVFDGTVSLTIGVPGNTDILMLATEIDVQSIGVYEVNPGIELPATTPILAYASFSGTTQGNGRIQVEITR